LINFLINAIEKASFVSGVCVILMARAFKKRVYREYFDKLQNKNAVGADLSAEKCVFKDETEGD
jgi:hypothetical protein